MSKDRKLESYRINGIVFFYLDLLLKTKSYSEAREFYVQPMREQRNQEISQILRKIQNSAMDIEMKPLSLRSKQLFSFR